MTTPADIAGAITRRVEKHLLTELREAVLGTGDDHAS